jgi:hypothetical protein
MMVLGCRRDGVVQIWEPETGRLIHTFQGPQPKGACLYTSEREGRYRLATGDDKHGAVVVYDLGEAPPPEPAIRAANKLG